MRNHVHTLRPSHSAAHAECHFLRQSGAHGHAAVFAEEARGSFNNSRFVGSGVSAKAAVVYLLGPASAAAGLATAVTLAGSTFQGFEPGDAHGGQALVASVRKALLDPPPAPAAAPADAAASTAALGTSAVFTDTPGIHVEVFDDFGLNMTVTAYVEPQPLAAAASAPALRFLSAQDPALLAAQRGLDAASSSQVRPRPSGAVDCVRPLSSRLFHGLSSSTEVRQRVEGLWKYQLVTPCLIWKPSRPA